MNRFATAPAEPFAGAPPDGQPSTENGRPKTPRRARQNGGPANPAGDDIFRRLAAPFAADSISFKPQAINGRKALAVAYLDARAVMDRLDEVLGPGGWQDDYTAMPDGGIKCTLALRIDGEWVSKSDVGSRSDQPDEGDQIKAAFSDALKRAAVRWAIGRYLYHLPKQWIGYDPDRRSFTETPKLPAWALPNGHTDSPPRPAVDKNVKPAATKQPAVPAQTAQQPQLAAHQPPPQSSNSKPSDGHPTDGRALFRWLKDEERALVDDRLCRPGELVEHVAQAGAAAGHGTQIVRWAPTAVRFGVNAALGFIADRKGETAGAASADSPAGSNDIPY